METGSLNISGFMTLSFPTPNVTGRRRDGALHQYSRGLCGVLLRLDLHRGGRLRHSPVGLDFDLPRFQGLRDLANEIDRQQSVLQIRSADPNMVGELETMFERPAGDATMQIAVVGGLLLLAGDGQKIGLKG